MPHRRTPREISVSIWIQWTCINTCKIYSTLRHMPWSLIQIPSKKNSFGLTVLSYLGFFPGGAHVSLSNLDVQTFVCFPCNIPCILLYIHFVLCENVISHSRGITGKISNSSLQPSSLFKAERNHNNSNTHLHVCHHSGYKLAQLNKLKSTA